MSRREIKGRDVARDIRSGMDDAQLMHKYQFFDKELVGLIRDGLEGRVIEPSDRRLQLSREVRRKVLDDEPVLSAHGLVDPIPVSDRQCPEIMGMIVELAEVSLTVRGIGATIDEIKSFVIPADQLVLIDPVPFEATCRWVKRDEADGEYTAGFEITDISEEALHGVRDLIRSVAPVQEDESVNYLFADDEEPTQSVDLTSMLSSDVTSSGSFDLGRFKRSWFGKLVQVLPIPALLVDQSCRIALANQSCNKLSAAFDTVVDSEFASLFPSPSVGKNAQSKVQRVFATRHPVSWQSVLQVGDARIWGRVSLRSIRAGEQRFVLVLVEDLSSEKRELLLIKRYQQELKRAHNELEVRVAERTSELAKTNEQLREEISVRSAVERALRASEERYRTLFENSRDAIIMINEESDFVDLNPAFVELTGSSCREEVIKRKFWDYFVNPDEYVAMMKKLGDLEDVMDLDVKLWKQSGEVIDALLSVSYSKDKEGNTIGCQAVIRDITESRKMERLLRRAQKMEAVGTLAGGIAHDFNNILMAVIAYTELTMKMATNDAGIRGNLEEVLKAASRATELVRQILTFSRQTELERKPIQVHLLAKEATKLLRASIPATIQIQTDIDPAAGWVLGDPSQLHQVIMNLCTNAYQSMEGRHGVLEVRLTQEHLDEEVIAAEPGHPDMKPGKYMKLVVADSGRGMSGSTIDRIFEPYFTTKDPGEGTGLGLSVVHGIVKNYGGAIDVQSELGKGSTVTVYLPCCEPDSAVERLPEQPTAKGSENILFIDDEDQIRTVGKLILESHGYNVTAMSDPKEALAAFEENPYYFDVVITDLTMPDLTGVELAQAMKALRPDVPMILCTGFGESISVREAKEMGFRDFLLKPITYSALGKAVRMVLSHKEVHSDA